LSHCLNENEHANRTAAVCCTLFFPGKNLSRGCEVWQVLPKKYKKEGLLELGNIPFGVVLERGEDIEASHPFKKCNLADFIDGKGYFDLVKFIGFNPQSFPFIYRLACCLASMRVNEVGCERFVSIAGYVSNPRHTSLKVRHYTREALAMLKLNIQKIYKLMKSR
jgi:hypothetical protein